MRDPGNEVEYHSGLLAVSFQFVDWTTLYYMY